jgi:hypothetical protein
VLAATLTTALIGCEIQLQRKLTPPLVFGQVVNHHTARTSQKQDESATPLQQIYEYLMKSPESILHRNIIPSLFVGPWAMVSSSMAYLLPSTQGSDHIQFRQIVTSRPDGAALALNWELPSAMSRESNF